MSYVTYLVIFVGFVHAGYNAQSFRLLTAYERLTIVIFLYYPIVIKSFESIALLSHIKFI